MFWIAPLLAVLAESEQASRQRARLQQLTGRLGLSKARGATGTNARLDWIESTHGLAVRREVERFLRTYISRSADVRPAWGKQPAISIGLVNSGQPMLRVPRGAHHRLDFLLPWVAQQLLVGGGSASSPVVLCQELLDAGVFDYLEDERPADLMQLGPEGLMDRADTWHERFRSSGEGTAAEPGLTVFRWLDGWRVDRLVTKSQLEDEGESMSHCVGGYWPSVRDGSTIILSARDPEGIPRVTAEITSEGHVIQVVGVENSTPPEDAGARIRHVLSPLAKAVPTSILTPDLMIAWLDTPEEDKAFLDANLLPADQDGRAEWDGLIDQLMELWGHFQFWTWHTELRYKVDEDNWEELAEEAGIEDVESADELEAVLLLNEEDDARDYWGAVRPLLSKLEDVAPAWVVEKDRGYSRDAEVWILRPDDDDADELLATELWVGSDQAGDPSMVAKVSEDSARSTWNPLQALRGVSTLASSAEIQAELDKTPEVELLAPPSVVLGRVQDHLDYAEGSIQP
jgi:hypothetical protein